ncbi:hypothetical protein D3C73_792140 [compost metagenome]
MVEMADFDGRAAHGPALGGAGIGVLEMAEAGGVFRGFAVDGQGVLRRGAHTGGAQQQGCGGEQKGRESQSHCQP